MRQPGGIRITEERELHALRRRLAKFPEATEAVMQAPHAMRRSVIEIGIDEVESWANRVTAP